MTPKDKYKGYGWCWSLGKEFEFGDSKEFRRSW